MRILYFLMLSLFSLPALAHVKWFSAFNFTQPPLQLAGLNSPTFWGLFCLSVISMPLMVYLDKLADGSQVYHRINSYLDRYSDKGPLIMRVSMGAVLLMSWQGDSIIAPELSISSPFWGWLELLFAILLLFQKTTPLVGVGLVSFWLMGIGRFGIFHMLDYVIYPAVGLYLIFTYSKTERFKNLDLPVLYSGLGFSLCWVAFEKLLYPSWGLSVLAKAPALTMGLDHQFFLMSCAFVEFSLGFLLIICLLHRPLAIVITLVFFTTTCFFGKMEVVGHTILHGALLVFIVKGPGSYYQAPIRWHKSPWLRSLFAAANFIVLFIVLAIPYQKMANAQFEKAKALHANTEKMIVPEGESAPTVNIEATQDKLGGWNLHLVTSNFTFAPELANAPDVMGKGHAHIYLDGEKIGRVYGDWYHVNLPKGTHRIKVTLNSNNHKDYFYQDKLVGHEIDIIEDRAAQDQHQH